MAPALRVESGDVLEGEPVVPIEEELLDGSSVPVTWTRLPTFLVSFSLSLETRWYVVPAIAEALPIELLEALGEVLLADELLLGDVLLVALESALVLPVVAGVLPDIEEPLDEPIMAFVSV